MKHWQQNKTFFLRCSVLMVVALVLCVGSFSVVADDFTSDDPMLRRLYELHLKLANQGNVESITRLGMMYESGEGVKKDRSKAIELYKSAAGQGYKPAIKLLDNITTNKSNGKLIDTIGELRVPTLKRESANDNAKTRLENKLKREQAEAEAAREELERLRQSKLEDEEKQRKLLEEIQNVKKVQEQLAQEREKAEAARREMLQLRKKQEEILKKQRAQREAGENQQEDLAKQSPVQQSPVDEQPQSKEKKDEKTFSSNPCNTPAAKFMSTCN